MGPDVVFEAISQLVQFVELDTPNIIGAKVARSGEVQKAYFAQLREGVQLQAQERRPTHLDLNHTTFTFNHISPTLNMLINREGYREIVDLIFAVVKKMQLPKRENTKLSTFVNGLWANQMLGDLPGTINEFLKALHSENAEENFAYLVVTILIDMGRDIDNHARQNNTTILQVAQTIADVLSDMVASSLKNPEYKVKSISAFKQMLLYAYGLDAEQYQQLLKIDTSGAAIDSSTTEMSHLRAMGEDLALHGDGTHLAGGAPVTVLFDKMQLSHAHSTMEEMVNLIQQGNVTGLREALSSIDPSECIHYINTKEHISGRKLIHWAVLWQNSAIIGLLTEFGARCNVTDKPMQTPLHYAVSMRKYGKEFNADNVYALLRMPKAENALATRNKQSLTPVQLAEQNGCLEELQGIQGAFKSQQSRIKKGK